MATDVARLSLAIDVTGAKRAQQAMAAVQSGSAKLTQVTNQQSVALTGLRGRLNTVRQGFRLQKGAVQQAGYQIGDFAVQVGAGQSALVAFSQQASQLAGIMGPGGAILGAVIAVGSAIAIPLVRSMGAGEEATKSFTERLQELRDATDELTDAQVRQLKLEFKAANRERLKQITAEKENIAELREEQERYQRLIDDPTARNRQARETGVTVTVTDLRKRLKELDGQIDESRANIDTYTLAADNAAQELDELIEGTDKTGDSAEKAAEKIREMVEAAEQQAATIGLSARATATYEAALAGANAEQILAIDQAYQRIEAEKAKQEALKESERRELATRKALMASTEIGVEDDPLLQRIAAEKRGQEILLQQQQDYATARQSLDQQILSSAASTMGGLANVVGQLAGEQSNAYRAAFLAQQGFAIASAIVNTQLAAAAALAPPPIGLGPVAGLPYAGKIEALGAANVAIIAGQTVAGLASSYSGGSSSDTEGSASFLGGGYTGSGSRTGGVDGKGGFPAILHPNETVIDHTMGQGMGGNTYIEVIDQSTGQKTYQHQSVMDASGNRQVRLLIRDMMREDIQKGEFDKQMQTSFGVRRRARRV